MRWITRYRMGSWVIPEMQTRGRQLGWDGEGWGFAFEPELGSYYNIAEMKYCFDPTETTFTRLGC